MKYQKTPKQQSRGHGGFLGSFLHLNTNKIFKNQGFLILEWTAGSSEARLGVVVDCSEAVNVTVIKNCPGIETHVLLIGEDCSNCSCGCCDSLKWPTFVLYWSLFELSALLSADFFLLSLVNKNKLNRILDTNHYFMSPEWWAEGK